MTLKPSKDATTRKRPFSKKSKVCWTCDRNSCLNWFSARMGSEATLHYSCDAFLMVALFCPAMVQGKFGGDKDKVSAELTRLEGMKAKKMTADKQQWMMRRINLLQKIHEEL